MVGTTKTFPGRAFHLKVSWDNLIFTWMIIPCTVQVGSIGGKIVVTIKGNQLVLDPIHQKKARQLSSFLKGVPTEMVNHC